MAHLHPAALIFIGALFIIALLLLVWLGKRVPLRRTVVPVAIACPLAYAAICALGLQGPLLLITMIANGLAMLILLVLVEGLLARFAGP